MTDAPVAAIEIVNRSFANSGYRAAIFDFDGTLSLLRRNWQDVMIPMMVEILERTPAAEPRDELFRIVEEFVMRLNGRQTIYQMIQLAKEVSDRGAEPREPLEYKHQYHELLWREVGQRVERTRGGETDPELMRVPNAADFLAQLERNGLTLYLASGTDLQYVRDEVAVLGLRDFFGEHIYGAVDDYQNFSKAMVIQRIIRDTGLSGANLVGFGDGFVEIEEIKKVGGLAVGVASNEESRAGVNAWKRERLIRAGADIIIADYRRRDQLLEMLGLERTV